MFLSSKRKEFSTSFPSSSALLSLLHKYSLKACSHSQTSFFLVVSLLHSDFCVHHSTDCYDRSQGFSLHLQLVAIQGQGTCPRSQSQNYQTEPEPESRFIFLQVSVCHLIPHCLFPKAAKQHVNKQVVSMPYDFNYQI